MSQAEPHHADLELSLLERHALVLVGHDIPPLDAAVMLGVQSAEIVFDALDAAAAKLGSRGYYAAYLEASERGLLAAPEPSPSPCRGRRAPRGPLTPSRLCLRA